MPGSFAFGFFGMGGGGELSVFVVLQVLGGGAEGEVGAEDAGGHEEGFFFVGGEEGELLEGFVNGGAVGIGIVVTIEGLEDVHGFGIAPDFSVGESVHPAARVLPRAGGEEVTVPGVGHFGDGFVIPIRATTTAGVVGDLAD